MKYPQITAEVPVRPASELPGDSAVGQVTDGQRRYVRWCDKDEPPVKPVTSGVVYQAPFWVWMLVAEAEAKGHKAMQLLKESQTSIGGDWRDRRDALLKEEGFDTN